MYQPKLLTFISTNESLDAIIDGLEPNNTDRILTVGGSGDQAFAILEKGAKVVCVDNNPSQTEYIKERYKLLEKRNYKQFAYPLACFDKDAIKYLKKPGRAENIRKNLSNLEIRDPADIMEIAKNEKGFTKLYLSNILGYHGTDYEQTKNIIKGLTTIARNLKQGSLIYVANHDWLCGRPEYKTFIKQTELLEIERELTKKAKNHETAYYIVWNPAVYRIK